MLDRNALIPKMWDFLNEVGNPTYKPSSYRKGNYTNSNLIFIKQMRILNRFTRGKLTQQTVREILPTS
jgi:hypothetical protein